MPEMTVTVAGPVPQQPQLLRAASTPLGQARVARGWSQEKAVRALVLLAQSWDWQIAAESSLKVQLSRWEHGATRPNETYRALLCAVYRTTPETLGFDRPQQSQTVKSLRERVNALESLVENLMGALSATQGVQA
ncbi:helix-turn-helix domain-containing protein [Streptomyces luteolus]|uniref:Helix-turn-helix transcriptional regulator n=1 Tax=Streptomyces luteolus TaxID=3043615 RepID=A0ABT6SR86_9ACTN|nr:helix-turn-helix transcriptional regulator [Streptomyces sp. B-S-A12]MDI3417901.1 helix-turn-helix transcriptional regulator [Streptomyces sp. B-S-A12]